MSQIIQAGAKSIQPVKADGSLPVPGDKDGWTIEAGATYYVELGGRDATHLSAHILMSAALVITSITVEVSNFPEASVRSTTAGEWVPETESAGIYVTTSDPAITVAAGSIAKAAGAAGAAFVHLPHMPALRVRLTIVVGAAGGVMRIATHAKD